MSLKDIADLTLYVAGIGAFAYAANELRKKYTNWAEKNNLSDESPKFSDLENKTYNVGDVVEFKGDKIVKL